MASLCAFASAHAPEKAQRDVGAAGGMAFVRNSGRFELEAPVCCGVERCMHTYTYYYIDTTLYPDVEGTKEPHLPAYEGASEQVPQHSLHIRFIGAVARSNDSSCNCLLPHKLGARCAVGDCTGDDTLIIVEVLDCHRIIRCKNQTAVTLGAGRHSKLQS